MTFSSPLDMAQKRWRRRIYEVSYRANLQS